MSDTWRNRIVGSALVDASTLTAHPDNWRLHPDEQGSALSSVLDDIGWVQEIIVNKTTGRIIDGHLRAELAIRRNEQIPVKYVELTEAEEESVLLTYDPLAAMAKTNAEKLDALLQRNNSDRPEIQQLMAELAQKSGLYSAEGQNPYDMWDGMPEFESKPLSYKSIHVHFKSKLDLDNFAELIGQNISEKTASIWFPYQEKRDLTSIEYKSDES